MVKEVIIENAFGTVTDDPNIGLNMDVKLRIGGRKAPKGGYVKLETLLNDDFDVYDMSESFFKDVKYNLDFENFRCIPEIFSTSTGINYIMAFADGDWQAPALLFIYFDGKRYRAYVPLKGNRINPYTKLVFGEETEYQIVHHAAPEYVDDFEDELEKSFELSDTPINVPACIEDFEARLQVI